MKDKEIREYCPELAKQCEIAISEDLSTLPDKELAQRYIDIYNDDSTYDLEADDIVQDYNSDDLTFTNNEYTYNTNVSPYLEYDEKLKEFSYRDLNRQVMVDGVEICTFEEDGISLSQDFRSFEVDEWSVSYHEYTDIIPYRLKALEELLRDNNGEQSGLCDHMRATERASIKPALKGLLLETLYRRTKAEIKRRYPTAKKDRWGHFDHHGWAEITLGIED